MKDVKEKESEILLKDLIEDFNFFVYGKPPLEYLRAVEGKVTTWSVYNSGLNDEELKYVRELHKNGIYISSSLQLC